MSSGSDPTGDGAPEPVPPPSDRTRVRRKPRRGHYDAATIDIQRLKKLRQQFPVLEHRRFKAPA